MTTVLVFTGHGRLPLEHRTRSAARQHCANLIHAVRTVGGKVKVAQRGRAWHFWNVEKDHFCALSLEDE